MPSYLGNTDVLGEIYYYLDVSGSVSDADIVRFHSELNYLLETFEMEAIKVIQFDEEITHEQVITDYALPVVSVGRRGTDLEPVRAHIEKHKPRSVIVFSDLDCDPMEDLSYPINLIWVVVGNQDVYPSFGKTIHIPRE
jgi:predicted metal-dependent peptidase